MSDSDKLTDSGASLRMRMRAMRAETAADALADIRRYRTRALEGDAEAEAYLHDMYRLIAERLPLPPLPPGVPSLAAMEHAITTWLDES